MGDYTAAFSEYLSTKIKGNEGFVDFHNYDQEKLKAVEKPLDKQVGGTHYKTFAIQPAEYNERNKIGFLEGNVIKYVSRWRSKDGIKDLEKAKHCIDILIELNADLPRS